MNNKLKALFDRKQLILLDGGMGTMLQAKGLQMGEAPERLNTDKPDWLIDIHRQYIEAGSDIIYSNTFGANRLKMKRCGIDVTETVKAAIRNARKAAEGTETLVALDIGPIGQLLAPTGTLSFEEAYDIFKEQVLAGSEADLIVIETMSDLYEVKAAVLAARENSTLPIVCTLTFEDNLRTFTGTCISASALTLESLGIDAIGVNCSLGPKELYPIVEEMSRWTNLPLVVKPNAGLPDPVT
ncbi:MAG: homocysteine S-methyltransferase family protein, partial [Ruminococcus sp.]|nr:homocysteine S-methyltransferase family protein [Ruminococcus sp.]